MALSNSQIQELIKEPAYKAQLIKALRHEQRVKFHAEESTDESDASPYKDDFLKFVGGILPADKLEMFKKVMSYPLYTNELVKGIADEYAKVYESQNSSFTYEFSNETLKADFKDYLRDTDFWSNWKDESSYAMLTAINSIVVIDMPKEVSIDVNPYYYFLSIQKVVDLSIDRDGNILYLISNLGDDRYLYIDETRYAVLVKGKGDNFTEEMTAPHDLGYCPACFFWKEPVKKNQPITKRSPLTSALTNLDWLLYFETARRCLETYAAYPIVVSYKDKCTYFEQKGNERYDCNEGYIDRGNGNVPCPACTKNKMIGPGTMFKVPMPRNKEQPNNIDAVKIIPAELDSLDYNTKRSTELWDEIFYDCVGYGGDDMQSQAVNEKQVRAGFESKQNILVSLKENLEVAHKFIVETIARLKYGNQFLEANINYGTDFYLKSSSEAVTEFKEAKAAGVPQYFITHKRNQIDSISTKGNDVDAERLSILKHLEPWMDMSLNDVKTLGLNEINREMFLLKADFSRLILKFESEYGSIVEFGSLIDFKTKIERIIKTLLTYVKEAYPEIKQQSGQPATGATA